ncbi:reverse transcriptase domain-containing protein, partial [Tanacetum coccineum]
KVTIPFPSCFYDDCYDEDEGSYGLKDLDTYSIRTTLLDDALPHKEKDPGSFTLPCIINNLCFNKALANLDASISVIPFSTYTNLGLGKLAPTKLIVELADRTMKHPKGIAENVLVGIDKFIFPVDFIVLDMPRDIKTPLILGRPFLSTDQAKIDVFKRKITLKVGNEKVEFKSDKPTSNIIKKVYALSLRERIKLDLEARLMGEALILNRSLDPLYGDYIKLNEPLELRRHQVDDLVPTIKEGEVVDEPMIDIVKTRCDNEVVDGLDEYLSYCDFDRKIHIDRAYNLQFSCMIDFVVVEYMDSYRDKEMGDIIVGRPFCRDARFKHLTDAQCNKMRPLLKVSAHDELKGISHPYKKLKGFYKEVLNLGSEYIKNEKVEEWLTRGHVSVHEME